MNLVIADDQDNRYFKQKEIFLFRIYKERKNICNYNNNSYNNEIFIIEPIYEEDFSLDYQPAFGDSNKQQVNNYDDYDNQYGVNPILPSINSNESFDYRNN